MYRILISFFLIFCFEFKGIGQSGGNNTCITADPFCGSAAYTFPSGGCTSNCIGETGPCYGCLALVQNPAWYYMQVSSPGNIILTITEVPYNDIDFCCWGPFTTATGACTAGLGCSQIVSCSFSGSGTEICTIPNAQAGEFYILVISNFTNFACQVTFLQSNWGQPGAGATNCNLVTNCTVSSLTATPGTCSPSTNTFSVSGTVEFSNPPPTGTLTVTDVTAVPPVSQVFSPPFSSPKLFTLNSITCDGLTHTVQASFSDSTNCYLTGTFQAPQAECPVAVISGGGTICNNGINTGTAYISISGGIPPYSFTWAVNGIPQTPVVNYSGPLPYAITVTSSGTYTMVSVSGSTCSGTGSGSATFNFVPLPAVSFQTPAPVCINTFPFLLTGGSPSGGIYSGPGVSGGMFNPATAGTGIHILTYTYTDANNCTDTAQASIVVNPMITVGITITASLNPVCEGTTVIFTAIPVNPGSSPVFQWKVNGTNAGINAPSYSYVPQPGDVVNCILSSSISNCTLNNPATSNAVNMTVNPLLPVSISISTPNNPVCDGIPVTFTAFPLNQGTLPAYQWKVNGINAGTNSSTFTYNPVNGDVVLCILTSDVTCPLNNPAASNPITLTVQPRPAVTFTSCFDTMTTVAARPFMLKGGVPPGGIYTGPGVNSFTGYFNPTSAGTGNKTILYTYQNMYSCRDSGRLTVRVLAVPVFSCGQVFTDIRDGKTYPTTLLGTQCWMQKNLDYGTMTSAAGHQKDNCIPEKYCYTDDLSKCQVYGGLYQWDELMNYEDSPGIQGICPPAWHIPTQGEWQTLFLYCREQSLAGKTLQDSIISGFRATEAGVNYSNQSWMFNGFATIFWTSNSYGAIKAVSHGMNLINYSVSDYLSNRSNGFAVRCVRD